MNTNKLNFFTIDGFNKSLKYIKIASVVSKYVEAGCNFATIVNAILDKIEVEQIPYMLNSLLVEKYGYSSLSFNLSKKTSIFEEILEIFNKWNQYNTVVVYYHPHLGILLLNPREKKKWDNVEFSINEFISIYTKTFPRHSSDQIDKYLLDVKRVLDLGEFSNESAYSGTDVFEKDIMEVRKKFAIDSRKKIQPVADSKKVKNADTASSAPDNKDTSKSEEPAKRKKVTPRYSIQVSNELFHNGNVEAWKNIIESYNEKNPNIEVLLFHNDELIRNVNSLFKWGKVKHGDIIFFCLAGDNFKLVAKLQRYLYEGASHRYAQFLKRDLNQSLKLF